MKSRWRLPCWEKRSGSKLAVITLADAQTGSAPDERRIYPRKVTHPYLDSTVEPHSGVGFWGALGAFAGLSVSAPHGAFGLDGWPLHKRYNSRDCRGMSRSSLEINIDNNYLSSVLFRHYLYNTIHLRGSKSSRAPLVSLGRLSRW